jgi:hypothetical protein
MAVVYGLMIFSGMLIWRVLAAKLFVLGAVV